MAEFFDKMIVGINKGASNIKEGSKNFVEKANLNTTLRKLEDEKKKLAELMGFRAYELIIGGTQITTELEGFCSEMANRDEQIEKIKQSLAALDSKQSNDSEAKSCSSCGNVNKSDAKFCAKCGTKLD